MDSFDLKAFKANGYAIKRHAIADSDIESLKTVADELTTTMKKAPAGMRDALRLSPAFSQTELQLRALAKFILDGEAFPVRSILFDKTPETNWDVVWHQDITIAVEQKIDTADFGPWSTKAGVPHVQPPASILDRMVTLRLHLDDCDQTNGPLLVLPQSHSHGFIDVRTLDTTDCDANSIACTVAAGDLVIMRPLTLHASRKSIKPNHRRVLHIEYAVDTLPNGLRWAIL